MDVSIWNIKTQKWESVLDIKRIYLSCSGDYFKLDGAEFKTSEYDINFIYDSKTREI